MFDKLYPTLLILLLSTFVLATPPVTPNKHILERQSSSCEAISAKPCPGSTNCCPQLWECKKDDPTLCTASIDSNYILTVSAINLESAQASQSRNIDSIRSQVSGALASITGGGSAASATPASSVASSAATIGGGQQASSGSQAVIEVTSTPTVRASVSTASLAAATVSATGAAALPQFEKHVAIGGLVGLGMFLL